MDDQRIAQITDAVEKQHTRTAALVVLQGIYPKPISILALRDSLNRSHAIEIGVVPLFAEIHYLQEKQLVSLVFSESWKKAKARITSRGIDFLEGSIKEVGLASPELYA